MIMLAQLPSTEISDSFSWTIEIVKISLRVIDIWAIKQIFEFLKQTLKRYDSRLRILVVGLGCASAHSILHYLLPMIPAKNIEFSWAYLMMAVDSNIFLVTFFVSTIRILVSFLHRIAEHFSLFCQCPARNLEGLPF
jgi:hypothetical protein